MDKYLRDLRGLLVEAMAAIGAAKYDAAREKITQSLERLGDLKKLRPTDPRDERLVAIESSRRKRFDRGYFDFSTIVERRAVDAVNGHGDGLCDE